MKTKIIFIVFVSTLLWLNSCKKDDDVSKPEITSMELGYDNSKTATLGNDLHVEAEVIAMAKINTIQVEIHTEGEDKKSTQEEVEWEFDSTYTEFSGLKNATFHKHVEIPVTAPTGTYHFHFIVTDLDGGQTTLEDEISIEEPTDTEAPVINISTSPSNGQSFSNGGTITISGTVTDDQLLGGLYIGLVRVDQSLSDADINATNTITMLHTHDFDSSTSHSFTASITVGAAQDNNMEPKDITGDIAWQTASYYILVKSKDAFGGNWAYSSHYAISITY